MNESEIVKNIASIPRGGAGLNISEEYPVEQYGVPLAEGTDTASLSWAELGEAGFDRQGDAPGMNDDATGEWKEFSYFGLRVGGEVVATWDEGRWWTPRESDAFVAAMMDPTVRRLAEEIGDFGMGAR